MQTCDHHGTRDIQQCHQCPACAERNRENMHGPPRPLRRNMRIAASAQRRLRQTQHEALQDKLPGIHDSSAPAMIKDRPHTTRATAKRLAIGPLS